MGANKNWYDGQPGAAFAHPIELNQTDKQRRCVEILDTLENMFNDLKVNVGVIDDDEAGIDKLLVKAIRSYDGGQQ